MNRIAVVLIACFGWQIHAAPVPKELKHNAKLEGTWKVESLLTHGQPAGQEGSFWTIDNAGMLTHHGEAKPPAKHSEITFVYNPGTKYVDYTIISGNRNYPGLFERHGDTLKFCFQLNDQTRPKTVEGGKDLNL